RRVPGLEAFAGSAFEARSRRRWWGAAVVAAAVVAVASGAAFRALHSDRQVASAVASVRAMRGEVILTRPGESPVPIGTGRVELVARDRVETTDARAEVDLSSGAVFELDRRTTLDLDSSAAAATQGE